MFYSDNSVLVGEVETTITRVDMATQSFDPGLDITWKSHLFFSMPMESSLIVTFKRYF